MRMHHSSLAACNTRADLLWCADNLSSTPALPYQPLAFPAITMRASFSDWISGFATVLSRIERPGARSPFYLKRNRISPLPADEMVECGTFHHQSLNVGSAHPPQTQGKLQSAVSLALSGM